MTPRAGTAAKIALALAMAASATAAAAGGGDWLGGPITKGWNRPGAAIPASPAAEVAPADFDRCKETIRPVSTPEDRAVTRAGWKLFGPYQRFGPTSIVLGLSGLDGMCRPLGYQALVFVDGRFAGTLSPVPMNSRTDGASAEVRLYQPSQLNVEFSRYADTDPLCCPSGRVAVAYTIENSEAGPVVVPASAYALAPPNPPEGRAVP